MTKKTYSKQHTCITTIYQQKDYSHFFVFFHYVKYPLRQVTAASWDDSFLAVLATVAPTFLICGLLASCLLRPSVLLQ